MFPRSRPKQNNQNEADEDRMASRLNLDLGILVFPRLSYVPLNHSVEQDTLSKKSAKDRAVDIFRGVSFSEWLRVIMQVWAYGIAESELTSALVLFLANKAWSV